MKKTLFLLMVIAIGLTACNEQKENNELLDFSEPELQLMESDLSTFQNSVYETYYNHFMAAEHGHLDYSAATQIMEETSGTLIWKIPSMNTIPTGSSELDQVPTAILFAAPLDNGEWLTQVSTFHEAQFQGGEVTGHIGLSLINGIEYGRINNLGKLADGEDVDDIPSVPDFGTWWDCTTSCYADAKKACGSDSSCDFLCDLVDLVDGCTISMSLACGGHCMNQGFQPPTDYGQPVQAPANDQNCFF